MSKIIDKLDYRNIHINFYGDGLGQQVYTDWEGKTICFGAFNSMYKEDMKGLIDKKLDTIYEFDKDSGYLGTHISWVYNSGWDDTIVTYKNRIIKIILTTITRDRVKINVLLKTLIEKAKLAVDSAKKHMR